MTLKICKKCGLKISEKEKGVTWTTFQGKDILEEVHFHWKCFLEWRNESLEIRAKKIYAETMQSVIPKFQQMMSNSNLKELDN